MSAATEPQGFVCRVPDEAFIETLDQARSAIRTATAIREFLTVDPHLVAGALLRLGDEDAARAFLGAATRELSAASRSASSLAAASWMPLMRASLEFARFTGDGQFLGQVWPLLSADGVIASATALDPEDIAARLAAAAALRDAWHAAQILEEPLRYEALVQAYCAVHDGLFLDLATHPAAVDRLPSRLIGAASAEGFTLDGLWPAEIPDPRPERTLATWREAFAPWRGDPARSPLPLALAGLRLGESTPARALVARPADPPPSTIHDALLWIHLQRDALLFEDRDTLVLFGGVPARWYDAGNAFHIEAPTRMGRVRVEVEAATDAVVLRFHPADRVVRECALVEWRLPPGRKAAEAWFNNRRLYDITEETVPFVPRQGTIRLELK